MVKMSVCIPLGAPVNILSYLLTTFANRHHRELGFYIPCFLGFISCTVYKCFVQEYNNMVVSSPLEVEHLL